MILRQRVGFDPIPEARSNSIEIILRDEGVNERSYHRAQVTAHC